MLLFTPIKTEKLCFTQKNIEGGQSSGKQCQLEFDCKMDVATVSNKTE